MFYVYILHYPDGRPFYVGKGKGNRMHHHKKEAERGGDSYKCRTIRKIWRSGGRVLKTKVFETPDEDAAYQMEMQIIEAIGRAVLTNIERGGRGRPSQPIAMPAELDWLQYIHRHAPNRWVSPAQAQETRAQALLAMLQYLVHQRQYAYQSRLAAEQIVALDNEIDEYRAILRPHYLREAHTQQEGFDF